LLSSSEETKSESAPPKSPIEIFLGNATLFDLLDLSLDDTFGDKLYDAFLPT